LKSAIPAIRSLAPKGNDMRRKITYYVGRSPDGVQRVFAQDYDPARAMANAFDAAREYIKKRPDCEPLALWSFDLA
jgi:hypothetical protein